MSLIQRIKAALGLDGAPDPGGDEPVAVTVEREPEDTGEDATGAVADDVAPDAASDEVTPDAPDEAAPDAAPTEADPDPSPPTAEDDAPAADEPVFTHPAPVTEISGIGPSYSERLAGADIVTVGELASADPEAVAAEADISETRLTGWIEQAKELATEES